MWGMTISLSLALSSQGCSRSHLNNDPWNLLKEESEEITYCCWHLIDVAQLPPKDRVPFTHGLWCYSPVQCGAGGFTSCPLSSLVAIWFWRQAYSMEPAPTARLQCERCLASPHELGSWLFVSCWACRLTTCIPEVPLPSSSDAPSQSPVVGFCYQYGAESTVSVHMLAGSTVGHGGWWLGDCILIRWQTACLPVSFPQMCSTSLG